MTEIAIVGMSCRFRGARNVTEFWQLMLDASPQFHSVPEGRWRRESFYEPNGRQAMHKAYTDQVAFLDEVDAFAPLHYGLPPKRAKAMDPQHRLLLDLAREAIQDAGWERRPFDRARTGVFVGLSASDYRQLTSTRLMSTMLADGSLHGDDGDDHLRTAVEDAADAAIAPLQAFSLAGCLLNMAPATVSNVLDLGGPSFALDAACSSALVALHQAVLQLRTGSCAAALVGGVFLSLTPDALVGFSRVRALSPNGVCRPFDQQADGFVLGEGGALLVIRPLEDAVANGDRIYAVIRGVGAANDGGGAGPMTPQSAGQEAALRAAYQDAGVAAGTLGLIEAHGTATTVGDRAELDALRAVRAGEPERQPCFLSSTKALIGHTLPAAGAAGLVKSALALHHATIPPQPPTTPHPDHPLIEAGLQIPTRRQPWDRPAAHARRAGVSSFGFGGTNVHAVLEEAPSRAVTSAVEVGDTRDVPSLLLLSAGTVELLAEHAESVRDAIAADPRMTPEDIAYTLATREPLTARLAVVATTRDEILTRLAEAARALRRGESGRLTGGVYAAAAPRPEADRRLAFLYPGQGSQRVGMLADMFRRFPAFRASVARLDEVVQELSGTSPTDLLWGTQSTRPGAENALTDTRACQPTLGVLGIGMTDLLAACRVRPDLTLGHSVGEFGAAVAAGALGPREAVRFLVQRGAAIADSGCPGEGAMLAVQATEAAFAALVDGIEGVWAGCVNHPTQIVASGRRDALARLEIRCRAQGVPAAPLSVSHAFHSPLVAEADGRAAQWVADLDLRPLERRLVSSVDGRLCSEPEQLRALWMRHASSPVLFGAAVRAAESEGANVFVQLYGGNSLLGMAKRSLAGPESAELVPLGAADPDDGGTFLTGLGRLAVLGVPVDLLPLFEVGSRMLVTLPPSPLAAQRYSVRKTDPARPASRLPERSGAAPDLIGLTNAGGVATPSAAPRATFTPDTVSPPQRRSPQEPSMSDLVRFLREQLEVLRAYAGAEDLSAGELDSAVESLRGPEARVYQFGRPDTMSGRTSPAVTSPMRLPVAAGNGADGATVTQLRDPKTTDLPGQPPQGAVSRAQSGGSTATRQETVARLLDAISGISAYPVDHLQLGHVFVDDLGFDSIMMTDLVVAVQRQWPELRVAHADFTRINTISDLVTVIEGALPSLPVHQSSHQIAPADVPHASPSAQAGPSATYHDLAEHADVTRFPEVIAVHQRGQLAAQLGVRNPYFLVHEGNIRDRTRVEGKDLISFSSYNYLGLSGHPSVNAAVKDAVDRYGSSVSAARILSGERPVHVDLDRSLAALLGAEAAVTLVSGHATNVTVIGHLVGPEDLIVHDSLAHDSILQGCRLSGATRRPFPHNDIAALDALLTQVRDRFRRVLVVVEGVYSMDGDIPDLPALIEVKRRHAALLMIDEAHSIGVLGAHGGGIGEQFDVSRTDVDVWAGTLSKSIASCGGYVAGRHELIEYLRYTLPGFIFSAGMTPANAAAALAALRVMQAEPERLERLRDRSALFCQLARSAGLNIGTSGGTPVVPCITGDSLRALRLADALFRRGVSVNPILYPAVEERFARLRFFVTAEHTPEQIEWTVGAVAEELGRFDTATAKEAA